MSGKSVRNSTVPAPEIDCGHGHSHDPSIAHSSPESDEHSLSMGGVLGGVLGTALMGPVGAYLGYEMGERAEALLTSVMTPEEEGLGLGEDVDAMIANSPTLTSNIEQLQEDGWTIRFGESGAGSFCDKEAKTIVIDVDSAGDTTDITQTLAHETGHALYEADPYVDFGDLSKEEYVDVNVNSALKDEGEATLMNLQIRQEILDATATADSEGTDIGVAGAASAQYIEAYEQWDGEGRDAMRQQIADIFAHGEHPSTAPDGDYYDYYAGTYRDHWDAHHPSNAAP